MLVVKPPTTIYFVRHGDVENPEQLYYGRMPGFPLSEQGRIQADAAGRFLQERPVATIYSSPQTRTMETAHLLQGALASTPDIVREEAINEIKSPYDGVAQSEMDKRAWNFYKDVRDGYEQPADVLKRMRQFINRVRLAHAGEEIIAVSHADPIVFVWMWILGLPLEPENRRLLDQYGLADDYPAKASVSTFRFETSVADERPDYDYIRPY